MLRLIHAQTVLGPIVLDDIDDGLPHKTARRGEGDPAALRTDGYANLPKQKAYIPRNKPNSSTIAGYIDLNQTDAVTLSASKGRIAGLVQAGRISVVSFVAADLATPVVSSGTVGAPSAGDLTIAGTGLASLTPNFTTVVITGSGAVTLTQTAIITGGGSVSNTAIVIPAALVPGIAATTSSVRVTADDNNSNVAVLV